MDAIHYEKIADQLMQFRGKLPKTGHLKDPKAILAAQMLRAQIDDFLELIDIVAIQDGKGWFR